ncbi:MAG: glycosyltransferase family 4 protein [Patescibacteria group bacterium]
MSILFFCRRFYPQIGGVEKHVLELSKQLLQRGHQVSVITESFSGAKQQETISGIQVYRIPVRKEGRSKKFYLWSYLLKKRELIQKADLVHCHDVFFWYLPFRFLYPEKPVYTTFHGYESYPIKKKAILIRKLSEKLSWGNICIGDFITKWYGTKPTFVSYGAVNLANNKRQIAKVKSSSAVFIGRLDEQTGIREYLNAFNLVKKQIPGFTMLVVGDGKERKLVEKKTNVLGFKKDPERYFAPYHFAFVSRYLSILEAFAAKRLVFALYDNPVKEDYLRLAPFADTIVIAKNAQELAEKVLYYLKHPEKEKKLISKSFTWVGKQTWENMAELYLNLWKTHS